jgi:hypothetical protein
MNVYRVAPPPPPRPNPHASRYRWKLGQITFAEHVDVVVEAARWDERWTGKVHVDPEIFL